MRYIACPGTGAKAKHSWSNGNALKQIVLHSKLGKSCLLRYGSQEIILKTAGIELYRSGAAHRHESTYARAKLCAGAVAAQKRLCFVSFPRQFLRPV